MFFSFDVIGILSKFPEFFEAPSALQTAIVIFAKKRYTVQKPSVPEVSYK